MPAIRYYEDKDKYSSANPTQPLSAKKKNRYDFKDAYVVDSGSYGLVVSVLWRRPKSSVKVAAVKIINKDPKKDSEDLGVDHVLPDPPKRGSRPRARRVVREERRLEKRKHSEAIDKRRADVKNEVRLLEQLNHPNIVLFFEFFESRVKFYISTELLVGGNLYDRMVNKAALTEKEAKPIVKDILEGAKYIHSLNIVHMDLKPENIIFRFKNQVAVIVDFGFARKIDDSERLSVYIHGWYVAPEILHSQKHDMTGRYQLKADIWSIGIIVALLISGHYPFLGPTVKEYCQNVLTDKIDYTSELWKGLSVSAISFVRSLLNKSRRERSSAAEALQHRWFDDTTAKGNDQKERRRYRLEEPLPPPSAAAAKGSDKKERRRYQLEEPLPPPPPAKGNDHRERRRYKLEEPLPPPPPPPPLRRKKSSSILNKLMGRNTKAEKTGNREERTDKSKNTSKRPPAEYFYK